MSRFDVDLEDLSYSSTRWCKRCEHSQHFSLLKFSLGLGSLTYFAPLATSLQWS